MDDDDDTAHTDVAVSIKLLGVDEVAVSAAAAVTLEVFGAIAARVVSIVSPTSSSRLSVGSCARRRSLASLFRLKAALRSRVSFEIGVFALGRNLEECCLESLTRIGVVSNSVDVVVAPASVLLQSPLFCDFSASKSISTTVDAVVDTDPTTESASAFASASVGSRRPRFICFRLCCSMMKNKERAALSSVVNTVRGG